MHPEVNAPAKRNDSCNKYNAMMNMRATIVVVVVVSGPAFALLAQSVCPLHP